MEHVLDAVKARMAALQRDGTPCFQSAWLGEVMGLPAGSYPASRVVPEVESEQDHTTGFRKETANLTVWADILWEDSEENQREILRITRALRADLRSDPTLGGIASEVTIGETHYVFTSRGGDTFRTSITQVRYEVEVPD